MASFYCVFLLGFLCIALTVDKVKSQAGGSAMTTAGPYDPAMVEATTPPGGEVELELEEIITTTGATTTRKPKPKPRRRRPKKQRKGGKRRRKQKTTAPTPAPTTLAPTTQAPTTPPPVVTYPPTQAPRSDNGYGRGQWGGRQQDRYSQQYSGYNGGGQRAHDRYNAYNTGGQSRMHVNVVATQAPTTQATTTPRYRYRHQAHSCPRMDVATWENEVVIYDNDNCAIIIRMNPRLRRPTVTFQQPYW